MEQNSSTCDAQLGRGEDKKPLRLIEKEVPKGDPDPKALACYGLWLAEEDMREMLLRFVDGRPVSSVTTRYLEWCCRKLCRKLWERGRASECSWWCGTMRRGTLAGRFGNGSESTTTK